MDYGSIIRTPAPVPGHLPGRGERVLYEKGDVGRPAEGADGLRGRGDDGGVGLEPADPGY
ncbi:Uncharacterised protein [uncultured Blautia sp.]|nr:Uncharacterised protein [uncultured Blautia sp.]